MAMAYCHHCDTYYDVDDLENYFEGEDGEFICDSCYQQLEDEKQPSEYDEWQSFDPDC